MKKISPLVFVLAVLLSIGGGAYAYFSMGSHSMQGMMANDDTPKHAQMVPTPDSSPIYSQNTQGLKEAEAGKEVQLSNGDTYDLVAAPVKKNLNGKEIRLLAYNGMLPGPRIRVRQGDEITIQFTNNTGVETTIHPHGVRVDNTADGVVDVTQKSVQPGETFAYKLRFPDAGVFWYHPHLRDDYQQESGLYANFYVEPSEGSWSGPTNSQEFLLLDDIALDQHGLVPFPQAVTDFALMGRFGNVLMINWETNYTLQGQKGEVKRLFLTNSANTRTFAFRIPGAKMKLIGSDGGLYEKEMFVNSVTISPSERYIVDVYFPTEGSFQILHETPKQKYILGHVVVSNTSVPTSHKESFDRLRVDNSVSNDMVPLKTHMQGAPDKELLLTMSMANMPMMDHSSMNHGPVDTTPPKIEWEDTMAMMNAMSTSQNTTWKIVDTKTGKENMDIDWSFKKGDLVKMRIINDAKALHPMQHPFHIHGQRFVILATNERENENMVWKDSVLVQAGDTMDILVDMSNPGSWMAHCHILEHLHSGMMFGFTVQ